MSTVQLDGPGGGAADTTQTTGARQPGCGDALARAGFGLSLNGVAVATATPMAPVDISVDGLVVAALPDSIVVETCPPNTGCKPSQAKLTVTAAKLAGIAPEGALVHVRYFARLTIGGDSMPGDESAVIVANLPSWKGLSNPIAGTERVWFSSLSAFGGSLYSLPDGFMPYTLEDVIECPFSSATNQTILSFELTIPGASPLIVGQGQVGNADVTSGPYAAHYVFRSLSHWSGIDGDPNNNYWLSSF